MAAACSRGDSRSRSSSHRRANRGLTLRSRIRIRAMSSENSKLSNTIGEVLSDAPSDEADVRAATRQHQHDFPYDRGEEAQVTRREFCNFLALTSTALFVSAVGIAGKAALDAGAEPSYAAMKIDGAQSLAPGSSLNFRYPNEDDTAILV